MSSSGLNSPKHIDVLMAKKAFEDGCNITEMLRQQKNTDLNTSEIIEVSYDIQAGSYIELAEKNAEHYANLCAEFARIVQRHVTADDTLLDIGTGELTNLSFMVQRFTTDPRHIFAFDISWSRIYKGMSYARNNMARCFDRLTPFVGDIGETPLLDNSVNVAMTIHALEPNGGRLPALLAEIFRVTKDKVILFEPCYEISSDAGRKRMDDLGYIKDIDSAVAALGGRLVEKIAIETDYNPLNPTVAFVIEPPAQPAPPPGPRGPLDIFAVPGTNHPLEPVDGFYFSKTTGLCFPVLKSIPVLKSNAAILSTALAT